MKAIKLITYLIWVLLASFSSNSLAESEEESGDDKEPSKEGASEAPAVPRVGHLDVEGLHQQFLSEEFKAHEVVWLDVEYPVPEEAQSGAEPVVVKVLSLQERSHKPQKHGAVLILPDKEQHADWPYLIRPLRKKLPESGWYTLSLNLPYEKSDFSGVPQRSLPAKLYDSVTVTDSLRQVLQSRIPSSSGSSKESEEETEASQETDDVQENSNASEASGVESATEANESDSTEKDEGESVDIDLAENKKIVPDLPYEERALTHIEAGVQYLRKEGYQNIVALAFRASADLIMKYLQNTQGQYSTRGFAIVMIDPLLRPEYQDDISQALGKNFPAPVLDLITQNDDDAKKAASGRKIFADVSGARKYSQIYLPIAGDSTNRTVPRRIKYWLETYAPGMVMQGR